MKASPFFFAAAALVAWKIVSAQDATSAPAWKLRAPGAAAEEEAASNQTWKLRAPGAASEGAASDAAVTAGDVPVPAGGTAAGAVVPFAAFAAFVAAAAGDDGGSASATQHSTSPTGR